MKKPMRKYHPGFFVETKTAGFGWTREGCNARVGGMFAPYETREKANAAIARLKKQDDPMWALADYRIVQARGI